ncbi:hypothetical protein CRV08_16040, partial [Halarcobacter ebronensis]
VIDGEAFTIQGEDFSVLASAIDGSPTLSPASYNSTSETLTINGVSFSTAGKTYNDLIADINAEGTYTAAEGNAIFINNKKFITAGEDFAALATEINSDPNFVASYNAGTNQLSINGHNFSTAAPATYADVATVINNNTSFTASTEIRGSISVTVDGEEKEFTITDTTTYAQLVDKINADPDLNASVTD